MSDTRFIILGVGLVFAGIIILSVFGAQFDEITMQEEFHVCYEYHADMPPTEIDCDIAAQNKMIIFAIVALLIAFFIPISAATKPMLLFASTKETD